MSSTLAGCTGPWMQPALCSSSRWGSFHSSSSPFLIDQDDLLDGQDGIALMWVIPRAWLREKLSCYKLSKCCLNTRWPETGQRPSLSGRIHATGRGHDTQADPGRLGPQCALSLTRCSGSGCLWKGVLLWWCFKRRKSLYVVSCPNVTVLPFWCIASSQEARHIRTCSWVHYGLSLSSSC